MTAALTAADRLQDLLADHATEGLGSAQLAELRGLLRERPGVDPQMFDLSAAAVDLAFGVAQEPLPRALALRVRRQAEAMLEARAAAAPAQPVGAGVAAVVEFPPRPSRRRLQAAGWYVAAAALLLTALSWWPRGKTPIPAPTLEAVQKAADATVLSFQATEDPVARGAEGELVWSTALQAGYMRFRGLPANETERFQYQLWIFDGNQDERYPLDGGVFDVAAGEEETVVAIDPKLRVVQPSLFAVTLEKAGGVVVSTRERLLLVAPMT